MERNGLWNRIYGRNIEKDYTNMLKHSIDIVNMPGTAQKTGVCLLPCVRKSLVCSRLMRWLVCNLHVQYVYVANN